VVTELLRLHAPLWPVLSSRSILALIAWELLGAVLVHTDDFLRFRWTAPATLVSIMIAGVLARYRPVSCLLSWNTGVARSSSCTFLTCFVARLGRLQTTQAFLLTIFCLTKIWIGMDLVAFLSLTLLDTLPTLPSAPSIYTGRVRWTAPTLLLGLARGSAELLIVDALLVAGGHSGRVGTVPTFSYLGATLVIAVSAAVTINSKVILALVLATPRTGRLRSAVSSLWKPSTAAWVKAKTSKYRFLLIHLCFSL